MAKLKSFRTEALEILLNIILQQEKLAEIREKILTSTGSEFDAVSQKYAAATVKLRHLNISYMKMTRKDPDNIVNFSSLPEFTKNELEKEIEKRKSNIIWTDERLEEFEELYPFTENRELAEHFGVSVKSIERKAGGLGLTKSKEFLSEQRRA